MLRREFFRLSVACSSVLISSNSLALQNTNHKIKVAICGGGFGGVSAAKYLKDLNPNINVTLIEKNTSFFSCPLSNAWLGGIDGITYESLRFDYQSAIDTYGYKFINEEILDIDIQNKIVKTKGNTLSYDYVIVALGVDYNYRKIFKRDKQKAKDAFFKAPAGLKPELEHRRLKKMISDFKGGNFVITIPSGSYKCPPAPYERACMIANYFKNNKIDGKIIIIDPRVKPAAKSLSFLKAFEESYLEYIEYRNLTSFKDVDFDKKIIYTKRYDKENDKYIVESIFFEEASIIPPNRANKIYKKAGIKTYAQGWVKLKRPSFRSVSHEDVYVIGDAQGEYPYPKSGQMANSCAYIVAQDISHRVIKKEFDYLNNLPGNVCYSIIDSSRAVSVTHSYTYENGILTDTFTSDIDNPTFIAAKLWYQGLTSDIFGIDTR